MPPDPWPGRNGKVAASSPGPRGRATSRWSSPTTTSGGATTRRRCAAAPAAGRGRGGAAPERVHGAAVARPLGHRSLAAQPCSRRGLPRHVRVAASACLVVGGYDGDVLFEIWSSRARCGCAGGRVVGVPGVFVGRVPPTCPTLPSPSGSVRPTTTSPSRCACCSALAVLPVAVSAAVRAPGALFGGAVPVVVLAEAGRRRAGGAAAYPRSCRSFGRCRDWSSSPSACRLALAQPPRGGVLSGACSSRAATPVRRLQSRVLVAPTAGQALARSVRCVQSAGSWRPSVAPARTRRPAGFLLLRAGRVPAQRGLHHRASPWSSRSFVSCACSPREPGSRRDRASVRRRRGTDCSRAEAHREIVAGEGTPRAGSGADRADMSGQRRNGPAMVRHLENVDRYQP